MTYAEAAAFWFGRINFEARPAAPGDLKLERMRALARLLGDPQERVRLIHVTGTKGKGSTAAMLAAILRVAGYRVGLFTSPHLERVEERIQVNGAAISPEELAAGVAEIAPLVRRMDAGPYPPPTFFEIGTALGFLHFARRRCDWAVIEVGLGGRFDSTNICRPEVAVVTNVGLDHVAQLGNTPESVAYQKAGIFKRGVPAVSGVTEPGPAAVVAGVAAEAGAPLRVARRDFGGDYEPGKPPTARLWTTDGAIPPTPLGLLGRHQAANAAVAAQVIALLRRSGVPISWDAVRRGLAEVCWPARVEVVGASPVVVLDTAHNVPSVEALLMTLAETFPDAGRRHLVFAVSSDKPYSQMLALLAPAFDALHFGRTRNPRCVAPERLAELAAGPGRDVACYADAPSAWRAARAAAGPGDLVVVTGSVFLAGELNALVRDEAETSRHSPRSSRYGSQEWPAGSEEDSAG